MFIDTRRKPKIHVTTFYFDPEFEIKSHFLRIEDGKSGRIPHFDDYLNLNIHSASWNSLFCFASNHFHGDSEQRRRWRRRGRWRGWRRCRFIRIGRVLGILFAAVHIVEFLYVLGRKSISLSNFRIILSGERTNIRDLERPHTTQPGLNRVWLH